MSRCQWLPRGTCGQTQYEDQELHDLANACGVRWTDRNYDEVCHDVSGVLQRLDVWKLQSEHPHTDLDAVTSEIRTLRSLLAQFSEDTADSEIVALLRRRMRALMPQQEALGRIRARELASEETARQQQRTESVQCDGVDLVTLDELDYSDPDVVSIVVHADRPGRPQCYQRSQLLAAMSSATPLFEWAHRVRDNSWEPGNPLLQSIFLLPIGNLAITAQGYVNLSDAAFRHYKLEEVGERVVGALVHTASAIWNSKVRIYHVVPTAASVPPEAQYHDKVNLFVVPAVDMTLKLATRPLFVTRHMALGGVLDPPDEREETGGVPDYDLELLLREIQKTAKYVARNPFPESGHPLLPSTFVPWDVIHRAPTFNPDLYVANLDNRLYVYALTAREVNPWVFQPTQNALVAFEGLVQGLGVAEGATLTLEQLHTLYQWEVEFLTQWFNNRDYLLGMVFPMVAKMPHDMDALFRERLLSTLKPQVTEPLIDLDRLFYAFNGSTIVGWLWSDERVIKPLPDRPDNLDAGSFVPHADIVRHWNPETAEYDALDYSELFSNRLRIYWRFFEDMSYDQTWMDALAEDMRVIKQALLATNPKYPETATLENVRQMYEWEVAFLPAHFPLWEDFYDLARHVRDQELALNFTGHHTLFHKRLVANMFQSISGEQLNLGRLFVEANSDAEVP